MNNPNRPPQDPVAKAVQDNGNAKLVGAKELLKEKLLGAVLQQAINELGEPASIARSIMAGKGADLGAIVAASRVLKELIIAEIELRSRQNFTDPVQVAKELFRPVSENGEVVDAISQELRAMILAAASHSAQESIADSAGVASELLQGDLIDPTLIDQIRNSLRSKMLHEAARRSNESLSDVEMASSEVLSSMGQDPKTIVELSVRVRELIIEDVASRANKSLEDRTSSAAQVWQRIGSDNESIRAVVEKVHDQLIGDIASRSRQALSDVEQTANIAREMIGENSEGVQSATKRLEEILIREIVQSGERALADTQNAVRIALEEIRPSKEDLTRIQEGLKSKILSDVLSRAIKEINDEVSATAADLWLADGTSALETALHKRVDRPTSPSLGESSPIDHTASVIASEDSKDSSAPDANEESSIAESTSHDESDLEWTTLASVVGTDVGTTEEDAAAEPENESDTSVEIEVTSDWVPHEDATEVTEVKDDLVKETDESTGWYLLEVADDAKIRDAASDAADFIDTAEWPVEELNTGSELREEDLRALSSEKPKAAEALGLLAGWRRKRKSWKVDEVDFGEQTPSATAVPDSGTPAIDREAAARTNMSASDVVAEAEMVKKNESWVVSIVRNSARLAVKVRESDQMIEESLGHISKGVVSFVKDEMNRLDGLEGGEAAQLMCEHCIQRTHTALSDRTDDNRVKDVSASELLGEDVIFVASYLVPKDGGQVVQDEVTRLAAEFEDLGFTLALHGPSSAAEFAKDGPSSAVTNAIA